MASCSSSWWWSRRLVDVRGSGVGPPPRFLSDDDQCKGGDQGEVPPMNSGPGGRRAMGVCVMCAALMSITALSGCDGVHRVPSQPAYVPFRCAAGDSLQQDRAVAILADSMCRAMARCRRAWAVPAHPGRCVSELSNLIRWRYLLHRDQADWGADCSALRECARAAEVFGCDQSVSRQPYLDLAFCPAVFRGRGGGEPCRGDMQCTSGRCSRASGQSAGSCAAPAGDGGACDSAGTGCSPGLHCHGKVCFQPRRGRRGDECTEGDLLLACADGLRCVSGRCAASSGKKLSLPKKAAMLCAFQHERTYHALPGTCPPGMICTPAAGEGEKNGRCRTIRDVGERCDSDWQCRGSDTRCDPTSRRCAYLPGRGKPCAPALHPPEIAEDSYYAIGTKPYRCAAGLICVNGRCRQRVRGADIRCSTPIPDCPPRSICLRPPHQRAGFCSR